MFDLALHAASLPASIELFCALVLTKVSGCILEKLILGQCCTQNQYQHVRAQDEQLDVSTRSHPAAYHIDIPLSIDSFSGQENRNSISPRFPMSPALDLTRLLI